MDHYKFTTVAPVGRLRAARRLDEQSVPQHDIPDANEQVIALTETSDTKDMLEEIGKRLSHIEISDDAQREGNKVFLVFDNGEQFEVNLSKVDEDTKD